MRDLSTCQYEPEKNILHPMEFTKLYEYGGVGGCGCGWGLRCGVPNYTLYLQSTAFLGPSRYKTVK